MRIMAIDYGDAHTGVAVSDPTGFLTGDVTTIHSRKAEVVLEELTRLVQTYQVDELVMGFPRNMDGTEGPRAELYREDIAVAAIDQEGVDRVTAAQAADELLSLKGVKASFVVFPSGENVQMSARSLGEVNVQVILEALGGGGNSTTAGGRVENTDVETVKSRLLEAIDAYFEK